MQNGYNDRNRGETPDEYDKVYLNDIYLPKDDPEDYDGDVLYSGSGKHDGYTPPVSYLSSTRSGEDVAGGDDDMVLLNETFLRGHESRQNTRRAPAKKRGKKKTRHNRFVSFLFPCKGDSTVEVIRKLVLLVAAAALIVSSVFLTNYLVQKIRFDKGLEDARKLYDPNLEGLEQNGIQSKFEALYAKNPDLRGWLTVPGTKTDNPVYQTADNDFYLTHDLNRKKNSYGALFLDYRDSITVSGNSQNQVIYGHHMKDGSMLAQITKYRDVNFYKQNPIITYNTLYRDAKYKVFAAFITNADPKDDNGYFYNYCVPEFNNQSEFMAWIEQARRRSLVVTDVDVKDYDEILTLSTCSNDLSSKVNLRFVVMGRKVREGEKAEVDLTAVKRNSNPLYPAVWYSRKGGARPQFADGLYQWHPGDEYDYSSENSSSQSESSQRRPGSEASSQTASASSSSSKPATTSPKPPDTNTGTTSPAGTQSGSEPSGTTSPPAGSQPNSESSGTNTETSSPAGSQPGSESSGTNTETASPAGSQPAPAA